MPEKVHVEVSDHALIRWLERNYGLDLEDERAKIKAHVEAAAQAGALRVSRAGVTLVLTPTRRDKRGVPFAVVATVLDCESSQRGARQFDQKPKGVQTKAETSRYDRKRRAGLKIAGAVR